MYLSNLVSLVRKNPNINDNTISAVDEFIGQISENGIFNKNELLSVLPQRKYLDIILQFLEENNIIEPATIKCSTCGREDRIDTSICDNCGSNIDITNDIHRYKIIASINISEAEKKQREDGRNRLLLTSFKFLTAKINHKIKKNEKGSILLFDLANTTELAKLDSILINRLKKEFNSLIRELGFMYLKNHNGHYIKFDGDSAFVYLNEFKDVLQFMVDFTEILLLNSCYASIIEINNRNYSNEMKSYIKIYHSASEINQYFKPDILSLDFTGMDAFVTNNRIEKKVKPVVLSEYKNEEYIPYFFCSTVDLNISNERKITINDVQNLGNVEVFLNTKNDIIEFMKTNEISPSM
jgi:hypothetical protein